MLLVTIRTISEIVHEMYGMGNWLFLSVCLQKKKSDDHLHQVRLRVLFTSEKLQLFICHPIGNNTNHVLSLVTIERYNKPLSKFQYLLFINLGGHELTLRIDESNRPTQSFY